MGERTVDWTGLRLRGEEPTDEGLRERKKRLMRRQLSDTATEMFLERGFDAVRVTEIAEACGVSEKTVFNYFPTKESLLLDLNEAVEDSLRATLADSALTPVEAALRILAEQLTAVTAWLAAQDDRDRAVADFRRFGGLIRSTASLRSYQRDRAEQLTAVVAEILARRTGADPHDPEPQIAATALLGLWPVQFQALGRYLDATRTPGQLHEAVTAHVTRAARLVDAGLGSRTWQPAGPAD
ncbi:AcrR family transcriptional regulator [Streptacidiphilus sp. MAP12-33]|uniref:TetR family transcriptional regulator n=1 Tax=Streptacidiphilus sp. MAP12-33 TaxID=3156266 RepID=UPI00351203DA